MCPTKKMRSILALLVVLSLATFNESMFAALGNRSGMGLRLRKGCQPYQDGVGVYRPKHIVHRQHSTMGTNMHIPNVNPKSVFIRFKYQRESAFGIENEFLLRWNL